MVELIQMVYVREKSVVKLRVGAQLGSDVGGFGDEDAQLGSDVGGFGDEEVTLDVNLNVVAPNYVVLRRLLIVLTTYFSDFFAKIKLKKLSFYILE